MRISLRLLRKFARRMARLADEGVDFSFVIEGEAGYDETGELALGLRADSPAELLDQLAALDVEAGYGRTRKVIGAAHYRLTLKGRGKPLPPEDLHDGHE